MAKAQHVAVEHRQPPAFPVRVLGDGLGQPGSQYRVDFDGGDGGAPAE